MEIKVLGSGCARCHETERRVMNALAQLGVAADVCKVTDVKEIMSYGVLGTPAIVVNGKVKCYGKVPAVEEVNKWLMEEKA
jgi:small redox-active disulfide protein 2